VRILAWQECFGTIGGVEIVAERLLAALRRRGHDLLVIAQQEVFNTPRARTPDGIPVHTFPFRGALENADIDALFELRREIGELKQRFAPDLVHLLSFGPGALFHLETARTHPCPTLVSLHSSFNLSAGAETTLLRRTLGAADWVTACSAFLLGETRRVAPEIAGRCSVVFNARETPPLAPAPFPTPSHLVCLGHLRPTKGYDVAIDAFASLADRYPTLRMTIAGDGEARSDLQGRIQALKLGERIEIVAALEPELVPELLNRATIAVVPSRNETFGLVALEAAIMARPVVASRVGGLPEVVADRKTGLLVEPDDGSGLAGAISSLLDDAELAVRLGRAGRRRALDVFDFERHVDAYENLFRQLAGRGELAAPSSGDRSPSF
jgi:glycogen(starch) synthase